MHPLLRLPSAARQRTWAAAAFVILAAALAAGPSARAQTTILRGFVEDATDGQPLPGVNVALEGGEAGLLGTATNADGYYQIGRIPPGDYVVRVTYVGYAPHVDTLTFRPGQLVTYGIGLVPASGTLDEVVVEAEGGAAPGAAGLQTVHGRDLARVPSPDASGDLASYLQTLPGVVTLGDRGGQLFVRGGTPAENLVLVDGMLVFQPFHIVGFFSAFPEDLVSFADVYAGGFGAQYSGRLSSVVDVSMRTGNKERFAAGASLAPFLSTVRVEGPIRRGRASFIASVRESVIERLEGVYGEPMPFRFGDRFAKVHAEITRNSQLSLVGLQTHDRGYIDPATAGDELTDDAVRWENSVLGARYLVLPRRIPVLAEFIVNTSYVENAVGATVRPQRRSAARMINSEAHVTHFAGGTRVQWGVFAHTLLLDYSLGGLFQDLEFDDVSRIESGLYVDAEVALTERLRVNPGVAVVTFPENFEVSVEPRLRAVWRPDGVAGRHRVSAAWGLYRQGLVGVSDERDVGSTFVAWMQPPSGHPVPAAMHAIVGWGLQATPGLRLTTEGYYKRLWNLSVPAWSALAAFTTTLELADGHAYGVDARLEWQRPGLFVYLGYGFSTVRYDAVQESFGVWYGDPVQSYHPPHDRRHGLDALASVELGGFDASVRWQFGSGLPFTRPLGFDDWVDLRHLADVRVRPGQVRLLYDKPYRARLPAYHRLDLSIGRSFDAPWGRATVQAGAVNVYDRDNLFYFDLFTVRRVDQLPLLPYAGLSVTVE